MKRLLSITLQLLLSVMVLVAGFPREAAARAAFASDVTIGAVTASYYQSAGPVELRVYPLNNFLKEDGTPVVAGSPGSGRFYSKVTCTVASNMISCPSITVPATESSPDNPNAKLGAYLYTSTGQAIGVFSVFDKFSVPDSPTTTNWADIRMHNVGALPTFASRDVAVTGDLEVSGNITAPTFTGNLIGNIQGNTSVSGNLNVMGVIYGSGAGITGLTGATGGVANSGSTTIGADTDGDAVGVIDEQINSVTKRRLNNDGTSDLIGGLPRSTRSGLPTVGNKGRLAIVTDDSNTLWIDNGTSWERVADQGCLTLLGCFDVQRSPYNCPAPDNASTDYAPCWQSAIDASDSYGRIWGSVRLKGNAGTYYLPSAITPTATHNSQLRLPLVPKTAQRYTMTIESRDGFMTSLPFRYPGAPQTKSGIVFQSTLTSQTYSLTNGKPCMIGGPDAIHGVGVDNFSFMTLNFKSVVLSAPQDPSLCGVNAEMLNRFVCEDCGFITSDPHLGDLTQAVPTHPTGVAAYTPRVNTDGALWKGFTYFVGWYGCYPFDEYSTQVGEVFVAQCTVNVNVGANSIGSDQFARGAYYVIPTAQNITSIRGKYDLAHVDPQAGVTAIPNSLGAVGFTPIKLFMRIEDGTVAASGSWAKIKNIYDPTMMLGGEFAFARTVSSVGTVAGTLNNAGGLNNAGALGLSFADIFTLGNDDKTVLKTTFGAADGTAALAAPFETNLPGSSWATSGGLTGLTIQKGKAFGATGGTRNDLVVDWGQSDGVLRWRVYGPTAAASEAVGGIYRYSDASNMFVWEWRIDTQEFTLYKTVGGSTTVVSTGNLSGAPYSIGPGQPVNVEVLLSGNNARFVVNGYSMFTVSDSFNASATKVGLHTFGNVGAVDEFTASLRR